MNIISFLKNKTAQNAWYLIVGKIIQMAFSLVVGMLTARYLGPTNYGLINYAGAYTAFFASVCNLGINNILVKELIDHPGEDGLVIGTTIGLRAISSFFSAIIIVVISCFIDAGEQITIIVVALASVGMIFHVSETFNYWFQARLESKITAYATLTAYIISSLYKISLLIRGKPVTYFALVSSIDYLCLGIIQFIPYKKHGGGKLAFSFQYGKSLLNRSKHFILSGLMVSIYGQTDKLMLKPLMGEAEVGYYSTAIVISGMWCFVLDAIIQSAYPSIMEANKESNTNLFIRRNKQLYAIIFYLSIVVSIIISVFAKPIIWVLYGETYLPATTPLQIVTWYTAFSYLGVARNAWIVSMNKQKYLFTIYLASAIINIILNLAFIPMLGAAGAAIASLVAQILTVVIVPFFIQDMRENSYMMIDAIRLKGIRGRDNT